MQIEFTCPNCRKLLRVAASEAGKRTLCPDCSLVIKVPDASTPSGPAGDFPDFGAPESTAKDDVSWSTSNWNSEPSSAGDDSAANPFSSPTSGYEDLHSLSLEEKARNQVAAPAMCLIVMGSIVFAFSALCSIVLLIGAIMEVFHDPAEAFFGLLSAVLLAGRPVLIIYGGIQMKKLQRYPFAITAGALAIISFCSCFIELAFGIWALVVLCRPHVKQAFKEMKLKQSSQHPF